MKCILHLGKYGKKDIDFANARTSWKIHKLEEDTLEHPHDKQNIELLV